MNRPNLYQKTVNLLLDAYNNETLKHGNCYACAVGNICRGSYAWGQAFTTSDTGKQHRNYLLPGWKISHKDVVELVESTGYTFDELADIEFAFESSVADTKDDPTRYYFYTTTKPKLGQYIGLCAVLDKLREIHEVDQASATDSQEKLTSIAKDRFEVIV